MKYIVGTTLVKMASAARELLETLKPICAEIVECIKWKTV